MTETQDLVRVVFTEKIYKKHIWTIPIRKVSENNFETGQDLTYNQMIGKDKLSPDEKKKYPHIINPHTYPKLPHGIKINRNNPEAFANLKLAILSGRIAESLSDYEQTPIRFVGYVEDKVADSEVYNSKRDLKYDAETAVRNSSIADYRRIALIVNYRMAKNIDARNSSEGFIKSELLKACDENAEEVLMCFPKWNPDIDKDIYILELISYRILTKRPNHEIYDNDVFVGADLSGVKNFMNRGSSAGDVDKWKKKLDAKKGLASQKTIDSLNEPLMSARIGKYKQLVADVKTALFDNNPKGAEYYYLTIEKEYGDLLDVATKDVLIDGISKGKSDKKDEALAVKVSSFKDSFALMSLFDIQKKITIKSSNYNKEDCKDFWEDKEKLVEYMSKIKFS